MDIPLRALQGRRSFLPWSHQHWQGPVYWDSVRSTWSRALIPCDPWSGSGSPICSPAVLSSSFRSADLPLPLVSDPMAAPTSSSKHSSPESSSSSLSEDDAERSSPVRFGLFPLAFQVSFFPMSFL